MNDTLRRTPLYDRQATLGARFVPFAGWEMPVQFQGVAEEHKAVRTAAGLFDVSHMGELWLEGPDAVAQVDSLITNDLSSKPPGKALYALCCNAEGGVLDDLIVYRVAEDRILVVCNAANHAKISQHFSATVSGACEFQDRSDATALLAVQGPLAPGIVAEVLKAPDLLAKPRFSVTEVPFNGQHVLAARTGYSGEDGFELFVPFEHATALWDALLAQGSPKGLVPIGLGARDTLRLEAALHLYGNDMDEQTNPYEAGLGWAVKLDKSTPFIGQEALRAAKARGVERRLVGFEMVGRGIARHGYPIHDLNGKRLGTVTSGAPALALDKKVGLGYVPTSATAVGTPIQIEIRGKAVDAVVCKTPFYRRSESA